MLEKLYEYVIYFVRHKKVFFFCSVTPGVEIIRWLTCGFGLPTKYILYFPANAK